MVVNPYEVNLSIYTFTFNMNFILDGLSTWPGEASSELERRETRRIESRVGQSVSQSPSGAPPEKTSSLFAAAYHGFTDFVWESGERKHEGRRKEP